MFREEEVSSCRDQLGEFKSAAGALSKWLEETTEKVPAAQPSSSKNLQKDLQSVSVSQEMWINRLKEIKLDIIQCGKLKRGRIYIHLFKKNPSALRGGSDVSIRKLYTGVGRLINTICRLDRMTEIEPRVLT